MRPEFIGQGTKSKNKALLQAMISSTQIPSQALKGHMEQFGQARMTTAMLVKPTLLK